MFGISLKTEEKRRWSLVLVAAMLLGASANSQAIPRASDVPTPEMQRQRIVNSVPPVYDKKGPDQSNSQRQNRDEKAAPDELREKPEPGEFQDFVFLSTGKRLDVFGASLFQGVPSTFAPVDGAPVSADYTVGPGDELIIHGWGQVEIDYSAVVDRTGQIFIPRVGSIAVAGVRFEQLQGLLKAAIGKDFHNFDLTVTLGKLRSIQVYVVGHTARPGAYTIGSLSTLVNALFASGGPSTSGSMRRIQLSRGGRKILEFDLYDLLLRGDKSKDVRLLPGDVIFVPAVGPQIAIVGSVASPGIFEGNSGTTLGEVLQYAGGPTPLASTSDIVVERIANRGLRQVDVIGLDQEQSLQYKMNDGDIVTVRSITGRFENAVTLRGHVANPGRYPWSEGMRIRDLIPSNDALITREYWTERARVDQKGLPGDARQNQERQEPEDPSKKVPPTREGGHLSTSREDAIESDRIRNDIHHPGADINWDYAVIQRLDPSDVSTRLLPFNLALALAGEESQNLPLRAGDVVTIFSQKDIQVPSTRQSKFVRIEGEVKSPGIYRVDAGETMKQLVARAGGLTSEAYLYAAELIRESAREQQQQRLDAFLEQSEREVEIAASKNSQNLTSVEDAAGLAAKTAAQRSLIQKLKQLKATGRVVLDIPPMGDLASLPDIRLESGDRIVIPFKPATVQVVGQVYNQNSFIHRQGLDVSDYLKEAGGLSRDADGGRIFIVRANGMTVANGRKAGWFTSSLNDKVLMPGDSIVVPQRLSQITLLKGLKDWSQVLSQFAFGVAAIKILRE